MWESYLKFSLHKFIWWKSHEQHEQVTHKEHEQVFLWGGVQSWRSLAWDRFIQSEMERSYWMVHQRGSFKWVIALIFAVKILTYFTIYLINTSNKWCHQPKMIVFYFLDLTTLNWSQFRHGFFYWKYMKRYKQFVEELQRLKAWIIVSLRCYLPYLTKIALDFSKDTHRIQ